MNNRPLDYFTMSASIAAGGAAGAELIGQRVVPTYVFAPLVIFLAVMGAFYAALRVTDGEDVEPETI